MIRAACVIFTDREAPNVAKQEKLTFAYCRTHGYLAVSIVFGQPEDARPLVERGLVDVVVCPYARMDVEAAGLPVEYCRGERHAHRLSDSSLAEALISRGIDPEQVAQLLAGGQNLTPARPERRRP